MTPRARTRSVRPFPFLLLLLFAAGALAVGSLAHAAAPPPPSELQAYLDSLRQAGVSELGRGELLTVSSVQERVDLMTFEKFGDVYVTQYQDRFCGIPGHATMPEVLAAEKGVDALRPLADFDGSGFVSTEEAARFRELFELGRSLPYVVEHEKTTDAAVLSRALRRSPAELAAASAEYPALTAKSRALFPPLPALQGLPPAAPRPAAPAGDDFQALAAKVRESGMSESARRDLLGLAAIRAGAAAMTPIKDPESGRYGMEYRRIEKDAGRRQALSEPALPELKRLADFDGSGFVTGEEAARLRHLVALGRQVPFVAQREGTDGPTVARHLGMKTEELKAKLADYARLAERSPGDLFPAPPALRF
jgi:hypothetical protein